MTRSPTARADPRNALTLLGVHVVAFVLLLIGFVLRVRYVEAEGVHVDGVAIALVIVATVVLIVLLGLLIAVRRRTALRRALAATGIPGPVTFCYWSRRSVPPFLAGPRGRGLDIAVTADADGLRVWALAHRRLIDFGLIPWSHLETIDRGDQTVGIGIPVRGGILRIDLGAHTPPYADRLDFFPLGQSAADAARSLSERRPRG